MRLPYATPVVSTSVSESRVVMEPLLEIQIPLIAKQPPERLIPLANVDVAAVPVTFRYVVCSAPENVEVELVPETFRNPWMVEVPAVVP